IACYVSKWRPTLSRFSLRRAVFPFLSAELYAMYLRLPIRILLASVIVALSVGSNARGQGVPNVWQPVGVDSYSSDLNWDAGGVPTLGLEERAVINNGGTAVLAVNTVPTVGGVDVTTGTLRIDRGGSLATGIGSSANGTLTVGAA